MSNKKISQLNASASILAAMQVPNNNAGTTERFTLSQLHQYMIGNSLIGLETSNAADTEHDITIAAGRCFDSTYAFLMILASSLTKRIDAAWAAGTAAGGLFTGSVGVSTTYHLFLIRKDSDGSIDAGWDTSLTAANKPAGYTYYRRIWSNLTDASSNIINYTQYGKYCQYNTAVITTVNANQNTVQTLAVRMPTGIIVKGYFHIVWAAPTSAEYLYFKSATQTDQVAATNGACSLHSEDDGTNLDECDIEIFTNTSAQINWRGSAALSMGIFYIIEKGYEDYTL